MAHWIAEDSNLNTLCYSCKKPTVPLLSIQIVQNDLPINSLNVPYLNPLVLRKELESILIVEGDAALNDQNFVEQHNIVYWNLVWYMERINMSTHLPQLYVTTIVSYFQIPIVFKYLIFILIFSTKTNVRIP